MNENIVRITNTWVGTPYHHQEDLKGKGCDCLGLVRGVWREYYGSSNEEEVPNYSPSWGDHRVDDPLLLVAKKYFTEKPFTAQSPGDLLIFRMKPNCAAKHCAIVSGEEHMIHAYSEHSVQEDFISAWWRSKIVGCFEFREN